MREDQACGTRIDCARDESSHAACDLGTATIAKHLVAQIAVRSVQEDDVKPLHGESAEKADEIALKPAISKIEYGSADFLLLACSNSFSSHQNAFRGVVVP